MSFGVSSFWASVEVLSAATARWYCKCSIDIRLFIVTNLSFLLSQTSRGCIFEYDFISLISQTFLSHSGRGKIRSR